MAKGVSVDPTSRSQLSHNASALHRVQRRAGLGPRFMVLVFLHSLISSCLEVCRRQIGADVDVRFWGEELT
jgi:hypothetical protein